MAKSAGYLRKYRERRAKNRGRPLGRALGKEARREVADLMANYGYSERKAVAEVRMANDMLRLHMAIAQGDFSKIAPKGRAPKGMGAEWRARKQIAHDLRRARERADRADSARRNYRGSKAGRYDDTRRSARIDAMRIFRRETTTILQGAGSWPQKAARVREQYQYVSWLISG